MARVRTDRLAAITASAAPLARETASSEASVTLCMTRELSATPESSGAAVVSGMRSMLAGLTSLPESHSTQSATVGQVTVAALDPTTKPKCPARITDS